MTDASLARSSAVMALGTVASRLLGFVRTSTWPFNTPNLQMPK